MIIITTMIKNLENFIQSNGVFAFGKGNIAASYRFQISPCNRKVLKRYSGRK
jgi:hypothetical protein